MPQRAAHRAVTDIGYPALTRRARAARARADFVILQDAEGKQKEKAERLRFGRFFYRFPNGESGADVYDRMTIFEARACRQCGVAGCTCCLQTVAQHLAAPAARVLRRGRGSYIVCGRASRSDVGLGAAGRQGEHIYA